MVKRVYYTGFWIHWFCDYDATIPNGTLTIGWTPLVSLGPLGVGPNCAANVMYGMFSCNGWGTGIVLQIPRDSINPAKKG